MFSDLAYVRYAACRMSVWTVFVVDVERFWPFDLKPVVGGAKI